MSRPARPSCLQDEAYLLHRRPYRDTSLIVEMLTRRYGRIALVCRAARRPRSSFHAINRAFGRLEIAWQGRGDLASLRTVEALSSPSILTGDRLLSALYINELLMRLLHRHDPCRPVFERYATVLVSLQGLSAADRNGLQRCLRTFECDLLALVGYGLVLDHDVQTGRPVASRMDYDYYPQFGPVEAGSPVHGQGSPIRVSGETLLALSTGCLDDERALRESRQLMRGVIRGCLGGRPLQSWRLLARGRSSEASVVAHACKEENA